MGSYYLTEMASWFREAGLTVIEYDGWKTRARGSGGYDRSDWPMCVMWHHTASSWSADKDAAYCATGDSDAPLSNILLARDGTVWILAAGATNTNGKGNPVTFSKGTVPENSMNTRAFGMEMANNGIGEPWPVAQLNAAFVVSNTVNAKLGNRPDDVCTHQHYAPTRKVDPATAAAVQGDWRPRSVTSSGTWNCDDLKAECLARAGARPIPPTPEPTPTQQFDLGAIHEEGDSMFVTSKDGAYWIGNGLGRRKVKDSDELNFLIDKFGKAGTPLVNFQGGQKVSQSSQINSSQQLNRLGVDISASAS